MNEPPAKHTGDPNSVRVTVPPGSPAVSAPQIQLPVETNGAGPAPAPADPATQARAAQGSAQEQWAAQAKAEGVHPEVVGIDALMELHAQQQRTQKMLLLAALVLLGAAVVVTMSRRGVPVEEFMEAEGT